MGSIPILGSTGRVIRPRSVETVDNDESAVMHAAHNPQERATRSDADMRAVGAQTHDPVTAVRRPLGNG